SGNYSFDRLLPGKYTIEASRKDRLASTQKATLAIGANRLDFQLKRGGFIQGRVVDKATGDVPRFDRSMSIQVTAINVAAAKAGRADANACKGWVNNDGTFSITAEPGQNLLVFSNPSWQLADARWAKQGVRVVADRTEDVELQLERRTGGWNSMISE